jgi:hypothetical protein
MLIDVINDYDKNIKLTINSYIFVVDNYGKLSLIIKNFLFNLFLIFQYHLFLHIFYQQGHLFFL